MPLHNGGETASNWHPSDSTVSSTADQKFDEQQQPLQHTSQTGAPSSGDNEDILGRINALLENTLNHDTASNKMPFSNDATKGMFSQMSHQPRSAPPIDFSFLAGVNPELYHSLGKTLDAMYPGSSNQGPSRPSQSPFATLRGGVGMPMQYASDSFIPGAISNRTLEHLTESTIMRPYRAIRGDVGGHSGATNFNQNRTDTNPYGAGIIGDRAGVAGGPIGGGGVGMMTSPTGGGYDRRAFNRSGSPADSDTSGIGSDFSETALLELMHSLRMNNSKQTPEQYFPYTSLASRPPQQGLHPSLQAAAGGAHSSAAPHLDINLLKALGIHHDFNGNHQPQRHVPQSHGMNSDGSPRRDQQCNDYGINTESVGNRPWTVQNTSPSACDPFCIERAAKLYRNAATISEPTCTWSGQLPLKMHRNPAYSCKVFLGGVPWDITESGLQASFRTFGPMRIEWPGKDGKHPRYPTKGKELPVGYVYVHFECERSVKSLLQSCTHDFSNGGEYYYKISSRRMRSKEVQVIPWILSDSNYVKQPSQRLDPQKTVFVGALHGMLNAEGLSHILNDLFGNVIYAGIDTDKHKYPIGSGRVTFCSHKSYVKAVSAAFVEIKTAKFTKKIQIDPYLEECACHVCGRDQGPYFCRDFTCFCYFCRSCWQLYHSSDATRFHKPLMRNNKSPSLNFGGNGGYGGDLGGAMDGDNGNGMM